MSFEELSLNWEGHDKTLVGFFQKILQQNTLVDCTIGAEGQYLRAHKLILSACSPYFEALFSEEKEKNPIVILKGIKFRDLKSMINFIYHGNVKIPVDRFKDFVEIADTLQIKSLGGQNSRIDSGRCNEFSSEDRGNSPIPQKLRSSSRNENFCSPLPNTTGDSENHAHAQNKLLPVVPSFNSNIPTCSSTSKTTASTSILQDSDTHCESPSPSPLVMLSTEEEISHADIPTLQLSCPVQSTSTDVEKSCGPETAVKTELEPISELYIVEPEHLIEPKDEVCVEEATLSEVGNGRTECVDEDMSSLPSQISADVEELTKEKIKHLRKRKQIEHLGETISPNRFTLKEKRKKATEGDFQIFLQYVPLTTHSVSSPKPSSNLSSNPSCLVLPCKSNTETCISEVSVPSTPNPHQPDNMEGLKELIKQLTQEKRDREVERAKAEEAILRKFSSIESYLKDIPNTLSSLEHRLSQLEKNKNSDLSVASTGYSGRNVSAVDPGNRKILLGHNIEITESAFEILRTAGDITSFAQAILLGVFGTEAKHYRLYPKKKTNRPFPPDFVEVVKSEYSKYLVRQGYKPPFSKRTLSSILGVLSRRAIDLNGRRNKVKGKISRCSSEQVESDHISEQAVEPDPETGFSTEVTAISPNSGPNVKEYLLESLDGVFLIEPDIQEDTSDNLMEDILPSREDDSDDDQI